MMSKHFPIAPLLLGATLLTASAPGFAAGVRAKRGSPKPADSGIIEEEDGPTGITESVDPPAATPSEGITETEEPPAAETAATKNTTLLQTFEGPRSKTIRKRVFAALAKDGIQLSPQGTEDGQEFGQDAIDYVAFGQKTGIRGFIEGKVRGTQSNWSVSMTVRSAKDGAVVGQGQLSAKNLPRLLREIDARATEVLGLPLSKTEQAKPGAAPALDVQLQPDFASSSAPPQQAKTADGAVGPSPLILNAGVGLLIRYFTYTDPYSDVYRFELVPHKNAALPTPMVELQWFPGAHSMHGLAANIGVELSYRKSMFGNTNAYVTDAQGQAVQKGFETAFSEFLAGIRGRIPVGDAQLGIFAGFGTQAISLEGDNESPPGGGPPDPGIIPDINYRLARFGVDSSFPVTDLISLHPGLFIRTAELGDEDGEIREARWFPNAEADGLELRVAATYALGSGLHLKAGAEYRQYGLSMNSDPETSIPDPYTPGANANNAIAGGAIDSYFGAFLMVGYTLPGKTIQ